MKKLNLYISKTTLFFMGVVASLTISCSFDEQVDPNRPSLEGILNNATKSQLDNLVVGIEDGMRINLEIQTTGSGTMARELYLFDADPRNTGDLLGKNGSSLDNNTFYATAPWGGRYTTIKNANILLEALENTEIVSEVEKNGYRGFAKTIQAYELIQVLKSYGKARIDVSDPENLGPILDFDTAIQQIRSLLDEAFTDINNGAFIFPLAGFGSAESPPAEQFYTAGGFAEFNRAVAALAAVYDNDASAALTALENSYLDLNGDLDVGPKHVFSLSPGDQTNGLFKENEGDLVIVNPSFFDDAEPGDTRVNEKTALRVIPDGATEAPSQDGLNGAYRIALYESQTAPVDIIRNEELILLYAEASIGAGNLGDAETALNIIRASAGLGVYTGPVTAEGLTSEMLQQRRYSLWAENHRMFDLRRYNLSNTLPIDRTGDLIFNVLPIPLSENE